MAQSSGFDVSKLSTATKVIGGATLLYLIVSFFAWNCVPGVDIPGVGSVGGGCAFTLWSGIGVLAGLLALVILAMTVMRILGVQMPPTLPTGTIVLGASLGLVAFTLLRVLIKPIPGVSVGIMAWIGLVLSLAVAYGGYMAFQEMKAGPSAAAPPAPPPGAAPPPPPPSGGFTG